MKLPVIEPRGKGSQQLAVVRVCGEGSRLGVRWLVFRSWLPSPIPVTHWAGGFASKNLDFFSHEMRIIRTPAPHSIVHIEGLAVLLSFQGCSHHNVTTIIIIRVIIVILVKIADH